MNRSSTISMIPIPSPGLPQRLHGEAALASDGRAPLRMMVWTTARVLRSWPVLATLGIALAVEIPYMVAMWQVEYGYVFVGMFWAPHDVSQYLAAMREGANGAWLIKDHLSGEPHSPAFIYPMYVLLGKVAALIGIGFERAYMLASSLARIVLLLAIYAATGLAFQHTPQRQVAFFLIVFAGGLTSLMAIFAGLTGVGVRLAAAELNVPEVSTFLTLFTAPHLMLALALLLWVARSLAAAWEGQRWGVWLTPVLTVLLGVVNSFSLATVCGVFVTFVVLQLWRRKATIAGVAAATSALVAASPFMLYSVLVFTRDPFWGATYGLQNQTLTHPPIDLLLGYGLLVPLALFGARGILREPTSGRLLVLTWIVVSAGLMYLPVGFQRRFTFGLHPMLGLAAAYALAPFWVWLRRNRPFPGNLWRLLGTALLLQALVGSTAFFYLFVFAGSPEPSRGLGAEVDADADRTAFQPASLRAAGQWLADRTGPDDIVLGHTVTGNLLGGLMPGRVYVGHWVATLDFSRKQRDMAWFYRGPFDEQRRQFLTDQRINFVVYGPHELSLGVVRPTTDVDARDQAGLYADGSPPSVWLDPVYDRDGVRVFAVRHS